MIGRIALDVDVDVQINGFELYEKLWLPRGLYQLDLTVLYLVLEPLNLLSL